MNDKISIIVPAYNVDKYIEKTLESILAQTWSAIEVITVDDGSTDKTGDLLDYYARQDNRIRVIHKDNGGVTSARLMGVQQSTGDWIGFVDGDDYIEPQMYQRLIENAQRENAQISHCGYKMVYPNGRTVPYYGTGHTIVQKGTKGCADLLAGQFVEPGLVNKLYRKELFESLSKKMDYTIRNTEDYLMNFYLFSKASVSVYEDFCPYHYLLRTGSAATAQKKYTNLQDPLRVFHKLMDETDGNPEWHTIVERRLAYQLIQLASIQISNQRELVLPIRSSARTELRKNLFRFISNENIEFKLKLMVIWTSIWPTSYGWVHRIYGKLSGQDRKYSVE